MSEWSEIAPWVAMGINSALSLYAIFNGRSKEAAKKTDERFAAFDLELKSRDTKIAVLVADNSLLTGRIAAVEKDVEHLPDKDVTHRLELALKTMQAEMTGLNEKMKPISAMAGRIQEAMIDKVMG
ncbi:hypothetical protein HU230_0008130 [Bradyrhizobium quebecense]|uniref:DUF2730 family protein n=1 Tax=Bradyrhizobium quebecense TaxID=2748629 RepID=A0A974AFG2_9BRAD|nr:hypothetical protein [Bradyrhizobium quebecense]UGA45994.1 hypothetical protein HU230_0008130 [Bradyrhizobium quebecense]